MFSTLFHAILYQPLFNLFIGLYDILPGHDVGLVILILTVLVRLAVYPLTTSSLKSQKAMQELQPKMEEVKKQYAGDQQKQAEALMSLYRTNKVSPFSSCLPLLVQLPVLIALYMVLQAGLSTETDLGKDLYSWVANPGRVNQISFWILDMAKPNIALAVLAGLAQFWQAKMMFRKQPPKEAGAGAKDESMTAMMNKQMMYMMPAMTVLIGFSLPAGLTWYWLFSTLAMVGQQHIMFRKKIS